MIKRLLYRSLSNRTRGMLDFDIMRFRARHFGNHPKEVTSRKLHFGCGRRKVGGWLNVDVRDSDFDMDFGVGKLPLRTASFDSIVSQEVIEHLELTDELIPLLREMHRILDRDGEAWLSCPDMKKVCSNYMRDRGAGLIADRLKRIPDFSLGHDIPSQHIINHLFHQDGEHKNLYDFELLEWALKKAGFSSVESVDEQKLMERFPEFPLRDDAMVCMYVMARK